MNQSRWINFEDLYFQIWAHFAVCHLPYFPKRYWKTSNERIIIPMVWSKQKLCQSSGWEALCPRFLLICCSSLYRISWKSFLEFSTSALWRRFGVSWGMFSNKHGTLPILNLTHLVRVLKKSVAYLHDKETWN